MKKIKKNIRKNISRVGETYKTVQHEIRQNTTKAILAAFAFIIAFVWRDAIKAGVNAMIEKAGITGSGYIYEIITAIIITVICVLGIMFFSRWGEKK